MKHSTNLIAATVLALASAGLIASGAALAADDNMEKCYGVAKARKNDCQTATSSCAGTAKEDRQKDAFIAVPKGTCSKISGGSLTPA
jgi:uncharacterized membrane protein